MARVLCNVMESDWAVHFIAPNGKSRIGPWLLLDSHDEVRAILAKLPDAVFGEEINCAALAEAVWLTGDATAAARLLPIVAQFGERWMVYWLDCEIVEAPIARLLAYLTGIGGDWALLSGDVRADDLLSDTIEGRDNDLFAARRADA